MPYKDLKKRQVYNREWNKKYYSKNKKKEIARVKKMEHVAISPSFLFAEVPGLSIEVRERLSKTRPQTLGQASRISGVTPAALSLLAIYLRRDLKAA